MHRIAGLDDVDDFLGITVDQRNLAGVTQGGREDVLDVVVVHLLRRTLLRRHDDLPRFLHVRHAEFRRLRRRLLDVARHQVDLFGVQLARSTPVRHTGRRTVLDEHLQVLRAALEHQVGRERLARGALAQHTVATGTALEIDLTRGIEFFLGHRRRLGVDVLVHLDIRQRRATRLVLPFGFTDVFVALRKRHRHRQRQRREHHCLAQPLVFHLPSP